LAVATSEPKRCRQTDGRTPERVPSPPCPPHVAVAPSPQGYPTGATRHPLALAESNASERLGVGELTSSRGGPDAPVSTYLLYNGCARPRSLGKAPCRCESARNLTSPGEYPKRCDLGSSRHPGSGVSVAKDSREASQGVKGLSHTVIAGSQRYLLPQKGRGRPLEVENAGGLGGLNPVPPSCCRRISRWPPPPCRLPVRRPAVVRETAPTTP